MPAPERPMAEAWQAQAWALAEALKAEGRIDPVAFAADLGGRLAQGQASDAHYWAAFLDVLASLAPLDPGEVAARRDAWEEAYRSTPHGAPVTLDQAPAPRHLRVSSLGYGNTAAEAGAHPMTQSPVIRISEVAADPDFTSENPERGRFEASFALIGRALGTTKIGLNLTTVPPGKTAWPRHYHYINDEMVIVLSGTGTLHYGEEDFALGPESVVHIKAGTGIPFQIENTGTSELRYLALSTLDPADVFVYPDSGKVGVMALAAPFRPLSEGHGLAPFRKWLMQDTEVPYWRGEPEAGPAQHE